VPFEKVKKRLDIEDFRWPRQLDRFVRSLRPNAVRIWRYEDFANESENIIRQLAFGLKGTLDGISDDRAVRQSFSGTAVDILKMISKKFDAETAGKLVNPITNNLPKGPDYPAFDPWDDEEKQRLRALYDRDCASFPESYWLVPPGKPTAANGQA
jgi:hypothetical protein